MGRDYRAEKVRSVVALGESPTWGYSASSRRACWVSIVCELLEAYQGAPIILRNMGVGSNVLTPLCPAYEISQKPCALERLERDALAYRPDLLLISYGLNDSRGGTDVETFRAEYQKLLDRARQACDPLIVLLNVYWMHEVCYACEGWSHADRAVTLRYNEAIERLARDNGALYADIYAAQRDVDWLVDPDHCHPNDLGHRLIANRVFETIARNCSFTAATMPATPSLERFVAQYGNGPQAPDA